MMMLIYSPTGLSQLQEEELDEALRRDRARIHYQGNDGADEYVIVEAAAFTHTERVGRQLGVSLAVAEPRKEGTTAHDRRAGRRQAVPPPPERP